MKLPNLGSSKYLPSSGRHLESPFGFLKTQTVLDLEGVHQQIIRIAHENAERRQVRNRRMLNRCGTSEEDDPSCKRTVDDNDSSYHQIIDENMQTTSIHSQLFKLERLSSAHPSAELGADTCTLKFKTSPDCLRQAVLPKIQISNSGAVSPSLHSVSRVSTQHTTTCFWCRKLGRWCGWCHRCQEVQQHHRSFEAARKINLSSETECSPESNSLERVHPVNYMSLKPKKRNMLRRHSWNREGIDSRDERKNARSASSLAAPFAKQFVNADSAINLQKSNETKKARGVICSELLQKSKSILLSILQEKYLCRMAVRARRMNYASGSIVFQQGDAADVRHVIRYSEDTGARSVVMAPSFYVVAQGVLFVTITDNADGSEVTVATLNVGDVVGEYSALLGHRRCCTVRAAVPCELIELMRSHLSRAIYESMQDEVDDREAEDERVLRQRKAERLLPLKAEREKQAAEEKAQISAVFTREIEMRVFGTILGDAQREREWTSGVHARKMKKELQQQMCEYYAVKIQRAVAMMRARRTVKKIKKSWSERLGAAIRIQRMFRGAMERSRMKQKMITLSNQISTGQGHAAAWTLQWLSRSRENKEEAEIDYQEKIVSEKYYKPLSANVKLRKLELVRKILCAVDNGTVVGMTFRCVCKDIAGPKIPLAAVRRWVYSRAVVQRKKTDESDTQWEDRKKRLDGLVEIAALDWCERSTLVQDIISEWKNDVSGFRQSEEQRLAAKQRWARYFPKGLLPDEIDAATVLSPSQIRSRT